MCCWHAQVCVYTVVCLLPRCSLSTWQLSSFRAVAPVFYYSYFCFLVPGNNELNETYRVKNAHAARETRSFFSRNFNSATVTCRQKCQVSFSFFDRGVLLLFWAPRRCWHFFVARLVSATRGTDFVKWYNNYLCRVAVSCVSYSAVYEPYKMKCQADVDYRCMLCYFALQHLHQKVYIANSVERFQRNLQAVKSDMFESSFN